MRCHAWSRVHKRRESRKYNRKDATMPAWQNPAGKPKDERAPSNTDVMS
eukprot:CAMPEP_0203916238 /NCGR_PEP_ID=MMETSP0359-20131031/56925_1 /ASSEMBLY_ACC=CAM_ASM_000338 /TAXON_ID=268821 /ORGANISM="Scrippsiella Hangoei, Strain SHTV-5" /LENGTH=48 /DNA_ID= /DNA_START= /DNA_END= /DNA_ORIENTATION=